MKRLITFSFACLLMVTSIELLYSQDFLVTVPKTDDHQGCFNPLKPGSTFQFQLTVKNQTSVSRVVSVNKSGMGEVISWVTVEVNAQSVAPGQTVTFLLTIKVPADAQDRDYYLPLYFDAYDEDTNNNPFTYFTQTIIVDKSNPEAPTFSVMPKSTALYVYSWDSYDSRSSAYTNIDHSSGVQGIKQFIVKVGNVSKTFNATDNHYYTFTGLSSNTNYNIEVKAIDLADNSNLFSKNQKTCPAIPAGISFVNTTYVGTTLNWIPSEGATGYDIYLVNGNTNVKMNPTPITGSSFTVEGLNPSTIYKYNLIALSAVGPSDRSTNVSVTTLSVPNIIGASQLCTSANSTYTIQLASGHTVTWSKTANLNLSPSGATAIVSKNGYGGASISAIINAQDGRVFKPQVKSVWLGKPEIHSAVPLAYYPNGGYNGVCNLQNYTTSITLSGASNLTWDRIAANPTNTSWSQIENDIKFSFWKVNQTAVFRVSSSNSCGTTSYDFGFKSITCADDPCDAVYTIAPNPASDRTTVIINIPAPCDVVQMQSSSINGYVAVYDNQGVLKKKIKYDSYGNIELDLDGLNNGLHHIEIYDGKTIHKEPIIIQK